MSHIISKLTKDQLCAQQLMYFHSWFLPAFLQMRIVLKLDHDPIPQKGKGDLLLMSMEMREEELEAL